MARDDHRFLLGQQVEHETGEGPCGNRIEVGRRFVGDDDFRVVDQSPRHGHPLLFASREAFDANVRLRFDAQARQQGPCAVPEVAVVVGARQPGDHHVLECGGAPDQVAVLKDETDMGSTHFGQEVLGKPRDIVPRDRDPPRAGAHHAADDPEQGRLAGAVGTLDQGDRVFGNAEGDAVDSRYGEVVSGAERLAHALEFDHGRLRARIRKRCFGDGAENDRMRPSGPVGNRLCVAQLQHRLPLSRPHCISRRTASVTWSKPRIP